MERGGRNERIRRRKEEIVKCEIERGEEEKDKKKKGGGKGIRQRRGWKEKEKEEIQKNKE